MTTEEKLVTHIRHQNQKPVNILLYNKVELHDKFEVSYFGNCLITFYSDFENVPAISWYFYLDEAKAEKLGLKIHVIVGSGCCRYPLNDIPTYDEADIIRHECSDHKSVKGVTAIGKGFIETTLNEFNEIVVSARKFLHERVEYDLQTKETIVL